MDLHRTTGLLCAVIILATASASAQPKKTVSGTVTGADGAPLPGVTVILAGSFNGTTTGDKGEYIIEAAAEDVLLFSCIGFKETSIQVGKKNRIDIVLEEDTITLEETVVTALGIKRSEKALGYSVSKVESEDLNNAVSSNWLNGLSGKVAGLNFDSASAGPSGSIRVTLRGESSLNPSKSEALFVVDGIPINSNMLSTSGQSSSAYNATSVDMPIDYGNGASDLNPDDIESVTVLKGAAATALYGSRAANGAIVITTKSGRIGKGLGVTFSSSYTWERPGYWPDFQDQYGAGNRNSIAQETLYSFYKISEEGIAASSNHYAYGPKFDGQMFYQYGNIDEYGNYYKTEWVARDWYKGFFQSGLTATNTVVIEGNNGKGSNGRVSYSDTRNSWITPNSGYGRQVLSASFASQINKWIDLSIKITYNHKGSDNMPMSGYGRSTIMGTLFWLSPNIDINWMRDYRDVAVSKNYSGSNQFYSNADSVFQQCYEQLNTMDRDRLYGNVVASIDFTRHLNLMLRTGLDHSSDLRTLQKPWGSHTYNHGRYQESIITQREINTDFLLKYDNRFGALKQFAITGMFGGNIMTQGYSKYSQTAVSLEVPGQYTLANASSALDTYFFRSNKQINSLYGMLQLSWKDMIFVDITGRNDWSSTLDPRWNSYFYPSVSASFLLNSMLGMGKGVDLLKFRASWANVGNDTSAYAIENYYNNSNFGGGVLLPTTISSADIKPEMTRSYELGLEGRFLTGRVSFDLAVYRAESYNQILSAPVDPATGFWNAMINAGLITNQGIEFSLGGQPVRTRDFKWDIHAVYSRNVNRVVELAEGVDSWQIAKLNNAQVLAIPNGTLGAIYGTGFSRVPENTVITMEDGTVRDISGEILFDAETGNPVIDKANTRYLGETQNKWKGGLQQTFSYKGFRLALQVDGAFGGHAYSNSASLLSMTGKLTNTLEGRYDGIIGDGYCYDAASGTYFRNKTVTESISYYYDQWYARENVESNIYSTSYIKLREARFEYSLPKRLMDKTKFLSGVSFAVYGRNLAMWTKWPIYDPEVACLDGTTITTGLEAAAFPMTRSFGFNLKIKF